MSINLARRKITNTVYCSILNPLWISSKIEWIDKLCGCWMRILFTFTHAKKTDFANRIASLFTSANCYVTINPIFVHESNIICDVMHALHIPIHKTAKLLRVYCISKSCPKFHWKSFAPFYDDFHLSKGKRRRRKNASHYRSIYVRLRQCGNSTHKSMY